MSAAFDGLTGALLCGLDIGQGKLRNAIATEPTIVLKEGFFVNPVSVLPAGWRVSRYSSTRMTSKRHQ